MSTSNYEDLCARNDKGQSDYDSAVEEALADAAYYDAKTKSLSAEIATLKDVLAAYADYKVSFVMHDGSISAGSVTVNKPSYEAAVSSVQAYLDSNPGFKRFIKDFKVELA